jgi:hypothetical protein
MILPSSKTNYYYYMIWGFQSGEGSYCGLWVYECAISYMITNILKEHNASISGFNPESVHKMFLQKFGTQLPYYITS